MAKIEILQKMVKESPENGDAWFLLGLEYAACNLTGEALQAFANALKFGDEILKQKVILEMSNFAKADHSPISQTNDLATQTPAATLDRKDDERKEESEAESLDEDQETGNVIPFRVISGGKTARNGPKQQPGPRVTFADVGGLEDLKEVIRMKIVKPFLVPSLFEKFKKKIGGGILLYGPPGCGKTFMAKATAGECNARFIPVHISDVLDPYIGVSEQNIKDIFANARAQTPCILFFDELDALGFNRAKSASPHMRSTIDQLLSEIEGIDSNMDKLLIIGATNMPWDVDPAFKRPGRFDRMIFVPPPDLEAREAIYRLKLAERPVENIDYRLLAEKSELYSGADIENVVEMATEAVIQEIMDSGYERTMKTQDLLIAIEKTTASTLEWLRAIKNYVKYANQGGLYDEVEKYLTRIKKL